MVRAKTDKPKESLTFTVHFCRRDLPHIEVHAITPGFAQFFDQEYFPVVSLIVALVMQED